MPAPSQDARAASDTVASDARVARTAGTSADPAELPRIGQPGPGWPRVATAGARVRRGPPPPRWPPTRPRGGGRQGGADSQLRPRGVEDEPGHPVVERAEQRVGELAAHRVRPLGEVAVVGPALVVDLGLVHESARVRLNGRDLATLIGPAFRVTIDAGQLAAENVLAAEFLKSEPLCI